MFVDLICENYVRTMFVDLICENYVSVFLYVGDVACSEAYDQRKRK